jgi:hypothetical protein
MHIFPNHVNHAEMWFQLDKPELVSAGAVERSDYPEYLPVEERPLRCYSNSLTLRDYVTKDNLRVCFPGVDDTILLNEHVDSIKGIKKETSLNMITLTLESPGVGSVKYSCLPDHKMRLREPIDNDEVVMKVGQDVFYLEFAVFDNVDIGCSVLYCNRWYTVTAIKVEA